MQSFLAFFFDDVLHLVPSVHTVIFTYNRHRELTCHRHMVTGESHHKQRLTVWTDSLIIYNILRSFWM